jgi:hypothetical protein
LQSIGMGSSSIHVGLGAVAAYLSRALVAYGWPVTLACGSLGGAGRSARSDGLLRPDIVRRYDETRWRGSDVATTQWTPFPMHPSLSRGRVPDRAFCGRFTLQGERR